MVRELGRSSHAKACMPRGSTTRRSPTRFVHGFVHETRRDGSRRAHGQDQRRERGGPAGRLRGGGHVARSGGSPDGRTTAARSAGPLPQVSSTPRYAAPMAAPARRPGPSSVPGILLRPRSRSRALPPVASHANAADRRPGRSQMREVTRPDERQKSSPSAPGVLFADDCPVRYRSMKGATASPRRLAEPTLDPGSAHQGSGICAKDVRHQRSGHSW
jgi:hypothetical protein